MTPEAVFAYAELLLRTPAGQPITPAPHHRLWVELMCDDRIDQLLILAPPESAKTSWVMAFCGLYIGVFPEYPIIIGSVSADVAERRSLSLRSLIESPAWRECFPDVFPVRGNKGLIWASDQWSVAPQGVPFPGRIHPTVAAAGTQGTVVGGRGRLVIGDDLLDRDKARTSHQRHEVEQWAHQEFFSRAMTNPKGRKILIGTSWHHDDLYARSQDPRQGWVVCHTPLLSPTPEVYATLTWPDDWKYELRGEPFQTIDPYHALIPVM